MFAALDRCLAFKTADKSLGVCLVFVEKAEALVKIANRPHSQDAPALLRADKLVNVIHQSRR